MKIIKKLIQIGLILFILLCAGFTYHGYRQYKTVIAKMPLSEKVSQIQASDTFVSYDEISSSLWKSTVAIEDHRFYQHNGFDVIATTRAFLTNLTQKGIFAGGSTITQQLAKNLYFEHHPSFVRKIAELFVVHDLETQYTKEDILTLYVNIINYGDNHMGIKAASYGYFYRDPAELTLAQSSLLAGLPQSPANYQLSNHEAAARIRQKQVLEAMLNEKFITEQEMEECLQE